MRGFLKRYRRQHELDEDQKAHAGAVPKCARTDGGVNWGGYGPESRWPKGKLKSADKRPKKGPREEDVNWYEARSARQPIPMSLSGLSWGLSARW